MCVGGWCLSREMHVLGSSPMWPCPSFSDLAVLCEVTMKLSALIIFLEVLKLNFYMADCVKNCSIP